MDGKKNGKDITRIGRSIEFIYPNCIVNEMVEKFLFVKTGYSVKVTKKREDKALWAKDEVLLKSYIDFVRFVCDFVENEMPREVYHRCWGNRIGETIDAITVMLEYGGKSEGCLQPGIYVDGQPVNCVGKYKRLTEKEHKDLWNEER